MLSSLKELYKIGPGPSSSHTIGPYNAANQFLSELDKQNGLSFKVTLFGSLALTGKGHGTERIIKNVLGESVTKIIYDIKSKIPHPNTMKFQSFEGEKLVKEETYISCGGGVIQKLGEKEPQEKLVYPFKNFSSLRKTIEKSNTKDLIEFVKLYEDDDIESYLNKMFDAMIDVIELGLKSEGEVAGELHVKRIAKSLFEEASKCTDSADKRSLLISSYAYSVSECNADNSMVVTAPTCGAAGVLPSVLYYYYKNLNYDRRDILNGLAAAGLIGVVIKRNASISGAVAGCQAEIGSATSMAAGAICAMNHLSMAHIEYAAEVGLEHQLGLTCDPVGGYVAIPCIERNAYSALKAYDSYIYAKYLKSHRQNAVSLDEVILAMKETGEDLRSDYKETSKGGLAKTHIIRRV